MNQCVCRLQDSFQESVLSFHHVKEMNSPETNSGRQAWGQKPVFIVSLRMKPILCDFSRLYDNLQQVSVKRFVLLK